MIEERRGDRYRGKERRTMQSSASLRKADAWKLRAKKREAEGRKQKE